MRAPEDVLSAVSVVLVGSMLIVGSVVENAPTGLWVLIWATVASLVVTAVVVARRRRWIRFAVALALLAFSLLYAFLVWFVSGISFARGLG